MINKQWAQYSVGQMLWIHSQYSDRNFIVEITKKISSEQVECVFYWHSHIDKVGQTESFGDSILWDIQVIE